MSVELWLNDYRGDMPQDTIVIGDSYEHGLIILLCSGEDGIIHMNLRVQTVKEHLFYS